MWAEKSLITPHRQRDTIEVVGLLCLSRQQTIPDFVFLTPPPPHTPYIHLHIMHNMPPPLPQYVANQHVGR